MRLHEEAEDQGIPPHQMVDGQVAVILNQGYVNQRYVGRIVQRYKDTLITLGMGSGDSFSGIIPSKSENMRVRILPKGTKLEI